MALHEATVTLDDVHRAAETIGGQVVRTPLVPAFRLSGRLGCELHLKCENFQVTGSFKDRGACNKLSALDAAQRARGVIAMSAGNHAQGVAYHAQRLGIPATVVMPEFAPFTKVQRTRAYGARVVLAGDTLDASFATARQIAEEQGLTFVHPYDDPLIVAGQGTIGLEMLADAPSLDTLVVPVGGGGLISGIATAAKALRPTLEVIGVEAALFPSMLQVLRGEPVSCGGTTLADGIAVKTPGELTRRIVRDLVGEILTVDEAALETAVHHLAEEQKMVAEGAGAAGLAAVIAEPQRFAGKRVGVVICGGNIDMRLLSGVLIRGLVRDGRLVRLRIAIVDQPGQLARLSQVIGTTGANIIEVHHQRLFADVPAKRAHIDVTLETRDAGHVTEIVAALEAAGFPARALASRSTDPTS
ncbi:threonine dehydratase [Leptolyngbya valderiana BDU 20041]|nr:threonine dehydratase [Leptolyngbya valderiana BDU 20041]